jgi:hypothetical protein
MSIPLFAVGAESNFTSTSSATLAAPNARRRALCIYSEGAGLLYVLLASGTASATNYTVKLAAGDYYEVPAGYLGIVVAIFATAGTARVTELT